MFASSAYTFSPFGEITTSNGALPVAVENGEPVTAVGTPVPALMEKTETCLSLASAIPPAPSCTPTRNPPVELARTCATPSTNGVPRLVSTPVLALILKPAIPDVAMSCPTY